MPRQTCLVVAIALAAALAGDPAHANSSTESQTDPFKIVNVQIEPLAVLYGIFGAEASFRLLDNWSLGASYTWFQYVGTRSTTAHQYGATFTWFPLGRKPGGGGMYGRGIFTLLPVDVTTANSERTLTNSVIGAIVGYQWMWSVGFNTNLGAGIGFHHQPARQTVTQGGTTFDQAVPVLNEVEPLLEWTVGWAF